MLATGPGEHAAGVKLPVARVEAAAHHSGRKLLERELAHSALHLTVHRLVRHHVNLPVAVGEVQQGTSQGFPRGILRHPEKLGR